MIRGPGEACPCSSLSKSDSTPFCRCRRFPTLLLPDPALSPSYFWPVVDGPLDDPAIFHSRVHSAWYRRSRRYVVSNVKTVVRRNTHVPANFYKLHARRHNFSLAKQIRNRFNDRFNNGNPTLRKRSWHELTLTFHFWFSQRRRTLSCLLFPFRNEFRSTFCGSHSRCSSRSRSRSVFSFRHGKSVVTENVIGERFLRWRNECVRIRI